MKTLRSVNTGFWTDEFTGDLSRDAQLLFLYFLTNQQTSITGAYKITRKVIKQDTGFSDVELDGLLEMFAEAGKVFYRDGWLFLPNFLKNQSFGGNLPKTAIRQALETPDWIQAEIAKAIKESPKLTAVFESAKDLVLCLKTTVLCHKTLSAKGKERKGIESEEERKNTQSAYVNPDVVDREVEYTETVMDGLRTRFGLLQLRDEPLWAAEIEQAFTNLIPPEQFLECYDLMRRQKWRKGRITPKNVGDNLYDIVKLRTEIEEQDAQTGSSNPSPKSTADTLELIGARPA